MVAAARVAARGALCHDPRPYRGRGGCARGTLTEMVIGIWQIVLIGLVIALLFGSHRIPALAAEAARGLRGLKRDLSGERAGSLDAPFDEGETDPKR